MSASLVQKAEAWRCGSLWRRTDGSRNQKKLLAGWPVDCPRNWKRIVNEPLTDEDLETVRRSVKRGCPFGEANWMRDIADRLGLESTVRGRGRPKGE